jgi:hypothetical protein
MTLSTGQIHVVQNALNRSVQITILEQVSVLTVAIKEPNTRRVRCSSSRF